MKAMGGTTKNEVEIMKYKAVIFDMDGTLLDTLADLTDSMNQVLGRLGFPGHDEEAYKYFVGDGIDILAKRALPSDQRSDALVAQCVAAMVEEYGRRWDLKTRPYQGIPELLDALTKKGLPMAILSNKPHDFSLLVADKLLARWTFQVILGARPSVPKKPDPAAALEIARHLQLTPEQILYLGDTGTDMKTATAAGMFPVGALWGFRTESELTAAGAKALIERPQELLKYV
jgi:phosphoglycolate phosphatase